MKFVKMSSEAAASEVMLMCCANCGISAVDDVKLKDCDDGCDLVKYCSDKCQDNHREQHGEECKKRLIELRDRNLFTQPEGSNLGRMPDLLFTVVAGSQKHLHGMLQQINLQWVRLCQSDA
jgi:hypothetical protein